MRPKLFYKEKVFEPRIYPRTNVMLNQFKLYHDKKPIKNILDFGSGIGNEAFFFLYIFFTKFFIFFDIPISIVYK